LNKEIDMERVEKVSKEECPSVTAISFETIHVTVKHIHHLAEVTSFHITSPVSK